MTNSFQVGGAPQRTKQLTNQNVCFFSSHLDKLSKWIFNVLQYLRELERAKNYNFPEGIFPTKELFVEVIKKATSWRRKKKGRNMLSGIFFGLKLSYVKANGVGIIIRPIITLITWISERKYRNQQILRCINLYNLIILELQFLCTTTFPSN